MYQFHEPQFEEDIKIAVIKSNNHTTEQTLSLYIQPNDPNSPLPIAAPNIDFRTSGLGECLNCDFV